MKIPLRVCAPELALTVQGAVLPEIDTDAQPTFELAVVDGQSLGEGVTVMLPAAPPAPALMLVVLKPYEQTAPVCQMPTLLPPTVKLPTRLSELAFALTVQDAVAPETETAAQLTPELAAAAEQSTGLGVIAIIPAPPAEPTFTLAGLTL